MSYEIRGVGFLNDVPAASRRRCRRLAVNDDLVDGLFVELARGCINRDEPLSDSINAGNYAPKKLAALARADGRRTTQVKLQSAMDRLLLRGRVAFIDHRHNGRDRRQLVINEHEEISL